MRTVVVPVLLLGLLACQHPRAGASVTPAAAPEPGFGVQAEPRWADPLVPAPGTVCEDLAQAFLMVARVRDQGRSHREQRRRIRASIRTPFVADPEAAQRQLLRIVDVVYRSPSATPEQFHAGVLERCVVDAQGRAVVGRPAPQP